MRRQEVFPRKHRASVAAVWLNADSCVCHLGGLHILTYTLHVVGTLPEHRWCSSAAVLRTCFIRTSQVAIGSKMPACAAITAAVNQFSRRRYNRSVEHRWSRLKLLRTRRACSATRRLRHKAWRTAQSCRGSLSCSFCAGLAPCAILSTTSRQRACARKLFKCGFEHDCETFRKAIT